MKKIFLLLIVLVLTACDNPFKKYQESFDALSAAINMANKVDTINTIIDRIDNSGTVDYTQLTAQDIKDITASLEYINENLDNEEVQAILNSYASQEGVALDKEVDTIKTEIANIAVTDRDGDGNTTNETAILTLITSILGKI